jgi:predicted lipase
VNRFGILCRPLEFELPKASRIVSACALLYNYIIENYNAKELDAEQANMSGCVRLKRSERVGVSQKASELLLVRVRVLDLI